MNRRNFLKLAITPFAAAVLNFPVAAKPKPAASLKLTPVVTKDIDESWAAGTEMIFMPENTNTGPMTLNVAGLGAKEIEITGAEIADYNGKYIVGGYNEKSFSYSIFSVEE